MSYLTWEKLMQFVERGMRLVQPVHSTPRRRIALNRAAPRVIPRFLAPSVRYQTDELGRRIVHSRASRMVTFQGGGNLIIDNAKGPRRNQLLAALPEDIWRRWEGLIESTEMTLGQVMYEPGDTLSHVYFPTTAIVSLLYVMKNGAPAEIAVIGNEGLVGISIFMGGESTPSRAVVQSAGQGYRLKSQSLKNEFAECMPVLHLLLRFTQALITQMSQTAVCNRHHSLDQQLCRWLLLSLDRLEGDELVMTQELIANMLGVRREGVTEGATRLQEAGLIRYARGRITVLNRGEIEKRSCECYEVVKKEYDRLLPERLAA
jgi:CRP-like cAMP-binding protein